LIDARVKELGDWRGKTLARVRALIKQADPAVVEEWKWNVPVWSHGGIICTGETYQHAVKVTFARGASLPDPSRLFNASLGGRARRAIDLHEGDRIDATAFKALVRAAVARNAGPSTTSAGSDAFSALRRLLQPYAKRLVVVHDTPDQYYLDTPHVMPSGRPLFFAAVRAGKAYVSFYLMPVYVFPELLKGVSAALRRRMHGKSCFNFRARDAALLAELRALTATGFARYRQAGYVGRAAAHRGSGRGTRRRAAR
jgi:hypothetical protein